MAIFNLTEKDVNNFDEFVNNMIRSTKTAVNFCLKCEHSLSENDEICESCSYNIATKCPCEDKSLCRNCISDKYNESEYLITFRNYTPDGSGDYELKQFTTTPEIYQKYVSISIECRTIFTIEILTSGEVCLSIFDVMNDEDIYIEIFKDYSEIYHRIESLCTKLSALDIEELKQKNSEDEEEFELIKGIL